MPNGTPQTTATPAPGAAESDQLKQLMERLASRAAQPRMVGPQPTLTPSQQSLMQPDPHPMRLTKGLFGLITNVAQHNKQTQLAHATQRIQGISDAITRAYELTTDPMTGQVNEEKAMQKFMESDQVKSLLSKEGLKDMKQMEKLQQLDFLNPEKNRTVWHEALEKVAKLSGAEKAIKGIQALMGKHKDKMAEAQRKQDELKQQQGEARSLAEAMFREAHPVQPDVSKILPAAMSAAERSNLEQQREVNREKLEGVRAANKDHFQQIAQEWAKNPDSIKNPVDKQIALGINAAAKGDEDEAKKHFDLAKQGAEAKKIMPMNLNQAISNYTRDDATPWQKEQAGKYLDYYKSLQKDLLAFRGAAFKVMTYMDMDSGLPVNLNYMDYKMGMAQGRNLQPMGQLPANMYVNAERVAATGKPVFDKLAASIKTFDNPKDRAVFAAFLKTMPNQFTDESSLRAWLGQIAIGDLSPEGQTYMQNVKVAVDVGFSVGRALGVPSTELGTTMTSMLLPGRDTPSADYGSKQLDTARNYIDSMMGIQVLSGLTKPKAAKATKKAAVAPKADAAPAGPKVYDLDNPPPANP